MLAATSEGSEIVAYTDADLSTPLAELARLIDRLVNEGDFDAVLGPRFRRLGSVSSAARSGTWSAGSTRPTPFKECWAFDVELVSRMDGAAVGSRLLGEDRGGATPGLACGAWLEAQPRRIGFGRLRSCS